jgi:hypothetical protein
LDRTLPRLLLHRQEIHRLIETRAEDTQVETAEPVNDGVDYPGRLGFYTCIAGNDLDRRTVSRGTE